MVSVDWKDVHPLAHRNTIDILESHGNKVSGPQSTVLRHLCGSLVHTAFHKNGRSAFPLPCGAGKTTAIRGVCKAVHDLGGDQRIVICAEKIEGLCEMKRDLIGKDGIPEGKISLLHSYTYDLQFDPNSSKPGTASELAINPTDLRQFVLMSHSKLHQGFNEFDHDLLIYDEALLLGKADTIIYEDWVGATGKFSAVIKARGTNATQNQLALSTWLNQAGPIMANAGDDVLAIPDLPLKIKDARKACRSVMGGDKTLQQFMEVVNADKEIRLIVDTNQKRALVTYGQTIPDDLKDIAVLDAAYQFRKLMAYDTTIKEAPLQAIKNHANVAIHTCSARAGRGSIINGLAKGKDLDLFHECADLAARQMKMGKRILIFTFKDSGKAAPIVKLRELVDHYLDGVAHKGELNFLTWGYETATNKYSHCDVVIFAGLLTLPHAEVAGRIFAQSQDIHKEFTSTELNEVVLSEKVNSLYQALCRGACRVMIDGEAKAMDAYIFSHDHEVLKEALRGAMPGVKTRRYRPKHLKAATKKDECKHAITEYLDILEGDSVSKTTLLRNFSTFTPDTKRDALNELLKAELAFDWAVDGRTLVRRKT